MRGHLGRLANSAQSLCYRAPVGLRRGPNGEAPKQASNAPGRDIRQCRHALIRQQVETRLTERTVEVFHRGQRVAAHARRYGGPRHGTLPDHMPSAHRLYAGVEPERFQSQARARLERTGPAKRPLLDGDQSYELGLGPVIN